MGVAVAASVLISACGGEMTSADFYLDAPPDPAATELVLLILYRECSNGELPRRAEWVEVAETEDRIEIEVGVRLPFSASGDYTCEGGMPGTPVTVRLEDPVGGRDIFMRQGTEVESVFEFVP
jgi:hypothetical protein